MRTKIYIDNQLIDVTDEIDLAFTYNVADIRTPENRSANYSKTITIPASKTNNELFTHIYDLGKTNNSPLDTQLSSDFDPNLKLDVRVTVDEIVQFEGYCQLVKINRDGAIPLNYEIIMIGLLSNIFKAIAEADLTELDLSEYDHIYSRTIQANSWDTSITKNGSPYVNFSGGAPIGEGYVYPLIDYGYGTFPGGNISVNHLLPAIYLKTYIDKIFSYAGYTYSSTFFDSALFKKLIIPSTKYTLKLSDEQVADRRVYAGNYLGSNEGNAGTYLNPPRPYLSSYYKFGWISPDAVGYGDPLDTIYTSQSLGSGYPFDDLPVYDSYYLCQTTGVYNITVKCGPFNGIFTREGYGDNLFFVTSTVGTFNLQFQLIKYDGSETVLDTASISYAPGALGLLPYTAGLGSVTMSSSSLTLTANERVYIKYRVSTDVAYTGYYVPGGSFPPPLVVTEAWAESPLYSGALPDGVLQDYSYFKVEPVVSVIAEDSTMTMNTMIPSGVKMKDLLSSVVRAFNLYLDIDRDNPTNYIIESRTAYYALGTDLDWSTKIDYSREIEVVPMGELDAIQYKYNYKEDKDYYNRTYKDANKEVYGNKVVDVNNDFNTNIKNTDLIFSSTPAVEDSITGIVAPKLHDYNDDGTIKQIDTNIRMLYYSGLKSGYTWYHVSATAGNSTTRTSYPFANHIDDVFSPTVDLNWDVPNQIYYNTTLYSLNNLYNRYHKKFIDEITDRDSKLLIAYFNLTPLDIYQFNFYDQVFVDGHYFVVNKIIDYNPLAEQTTKVELLKVKYYADFIQPGSEDGFRKPTGDTKPGFLYNIVEGGLNEVRDTGATIPYTILEGGLDEVRDIAATSIYNIVNGGNNSV